jgi:hypothetical protein
MGCDDLTDGFKEIHRQREEAATVLEKDGVVGLLAYSVEHTWGMTVDSKVAVRYKLAQYLSDINPENLEQINNSRTFILANVMLRNAGIESTDKDYEKLMTEMIMEIKNIDQTLEQFAVKLLGVVAVESATK